ncbi:MAG: YCF48-related protein [Ignavibacteriaceae bacterium]|nr:YCF48-related protein [Ignavibacteriaceae bacterium]
MKISVIFLLILMFMTITGISYTQIGWLSQINPIAPSTTNDLGKVQFVSATEGWIAASDGNLLHTTNAGAVWNIVTPFPNDTVNSSSDPANSMSWVNQTHGWKINWFGTSFGDAHGAVIHRTTDGGQTWTKNVLTTTLGDVGFQIQFVDELNGRVLIFNFLTGAAQFLKTTDGGVSWTPFNGAGIFYFVDVNNGWSYSGSGAQGANPPYNIYHTTNGGTNWNKQFSDSLLGTYNTIQFSDLNNGWIVGDNSKVLKTTNAGTTWTRVINTGIDPLSESKCVFFLNANTGWIGTNDGNINDNPIREVLYTTNGGANWTKQNIQNTEGIFSIFFWDNNNGWFTADNCVQNCNGPDSLKTWQGVVAHTTNGGVTGVTDKKYEPSQYALFDNYPNPFNPSTIISYSIPSASIVKLVVFNSLGQTVRILENGFKNAGNYSISFSANELPSGIYFYRLEAGQFSQIKKMNLLK